eukprot:g7419.t1
MDRSWTYLEGPGDDYDTRSMRSRSSSSIRRSELDRRHRRDRSVPRARAWDELPRSSSLRDLRRSASRSHSNHFWALDDFSAYRRHEGLGPIRRLVDVLHLGSDF